MIKGSAFKMKVNNILNKLNHEQIDNNVKILGIKSKFLQKFFDVKKLNMKHSTE